MALSPEALTFEVQRGFKLFKASTTMPDKTQLNWDDNPNDAMNTRTDGEFLLYNAPLGTGYIQTNGASWQKIQGTKGGKWERYVRGDSSGTAPSSPSSELAVAAISGDETLHFEDLSIFTDQQGYSILFETISEADEGEYLDTTFLFEGDSLFTTIAGDPIELATTQGLSDSLNTLLDNPEIGGSLSAVRPRLNIATAAIWISRPEYEVIIVDDTHTDRTYEVNSSQALIYVKEGSERGFSLICKAANNWTITPALIFFGDQPNVMGLMHTSVRECRFDKSVSTGNWEVRNYLTEDIRRFFSPFGGAEFITHLVDFELSTPEEMQTNIIDLRQQLTELTLLHAEEVEDIYSWANTRFNAYTATDSGLQQQLNALDIHNYDTPYRYSSSGNAGYRWGLLNTNPQTIGWGPYQKHTYLGNDVYSHKIQDSAYQLNTKQQVWSFEELQTAVLTIVAAAGYTN